MTPVLVRERHPNIIGEAESRVLSGEVMAFCPVCKAFQTLWLADGKLLQTRKFTQLGDQIYHDCCVSRPCRLYHLT